MTSLETPEKNDTSFQQQNTSRGTHTGIIVAVVAVVLIVAVVALSIFFLKNSSSQAPKSNTTATSAPTPSTISLSTTELANSGISLGKELVADTKNEGATQVDIYFDYSCSHCNHLGNDYGAKLGDAAKAGDITLIYHPVAIMNTLFSYTGTGAEIFIAENEPDKYFAFHELLHKKIMTPYMNGDLTNPRAENIVDIAREAGVSDKNCEALSKELTEMEDVLLHGTPEDATPLLTKVLDKTELFVNSGGTGTPTVIIDGKKSENWTEDLNRLLDK